MPRKASQAAKKDTTAEPKSEGGTTRRSGRAATKQEPSKETSKEATRSRRSSTAAQTAASVADSKTPKRSTSSRRDSTSPSDGRQKSRRESVESPATRVKSTRRSTGRINYKESDGEDESATPKYDENFDSNEEFDDSDSDEKNKQKGRTTRAAKPPARGRGLREKSRGAKGRRGRPKKQSSDEDDNEPIELSEESIEVEEEIIKKTATPTKESTRGGRSRKSRTESETKSSVEEKPKSSRRSARASTVKDDPPKKRPSRSLQTKRYTEEDDDDDIEEIDDPKAEEDVKPKLDSGRKRKRGSTTESNKRLKEEDVIEIKEDEGNADEETVEKDESKPIVETESEKEKKDDSADEPMEVDASDGGDTSDNGKTAPRNKEEEVEEKNESSKEGKKENKKTEETENLVFNTSKEKLNYSNKQESVDSSENLDESMHSFDSDQGSRAEQSISSGLEDSQDTKETKPKENTVPQKEGSASENIKSQVDYQPDSSNSFQELDDSSESKGLNETVVNNEQKQEPAIDKKETKPDTKTDSSAEGFQNDTNILPENKTVELDKTPVTPPVSSVTHSKESNNETSLNGSESVSNSSHVIHSTSAVNLHPEDSAPKANGAHDLHNNSVSENDQYYPFPGRKYIINAKLGDSIRQSVKDKSFGFVSYNLGVTSSDSSIQKEKLLNEFNKLDAHIICIQQVSKPFYCSILEPSLDALGFKGTFSQPEESEKGMATFYKSSLFRLCGQSEASLKHLIEKELEASSLDTNDRMAVKSYVKQCGHVLFTHFATVIGMHSLTVANVQVPLTDLSIHALQVSCLVREVVRINGGTSRPFLLGGEFNMMESEAPYQLLRDGYLSNDMIEELQKRKDVALPEKENAALVNLLWKSFQHPSSTLCSCYKSVLDHEVFIPEQKITSQDLLWYSSDSLYTVGVLDASETYSDHHFSLKADVAFSV